MDHLRRVQRPGLVDGDGDNDDQARVKAHADLVKVIRAVWPCSCDELWHDPDHVIGTRLWHAHDPACGYPERLAAAIEKLHAVTSA